MAKMRSAVLNGPKRVEVVEDAVPGPKPGRVIVRVRNCGICGTDLHYYEGVFPSKPSMRMGHEMSGEVAVLGEGVSTLRVGQPVTIEPVEVCRECDYCRSGRRELCPERKFVGIDLPGAFAEFIDVPAYLVYPLPEGLDVEVGALVEPLAVALHGLRVAGVEPCERLAVVGSGTIGMMTLLAAHALGVSEVSMIARHPHQAEMASALGATQVARAGPNAVEALLKAWGGNQPEVVVETVGGHGETIDDAITSVRPGGRVSVLGLFAEAPHANALLALLKEITIQFGTVYGHVRGRSDFGLALALIPTLGN